MFIEKIITYGFIMTKLTNFYKFWFELKNFKKAPKNKVLALFNVIAVC
jgi:hypothetical protein